MSQKPEEMLSSIMTPWMMVAVSCAALPFLHAARGLQTTEWFGGFLPLFIAIIIGIAAGVSLTAAARRLCGFTGSWRFSWEFADGTLRGALRDFRLGLADRPRARGR